MTKAKSFPKIEVRLSNNVVGNIAITKDGLAAFEYTPSFLSEQFSISPFYLPLKSGVFIARREPFGGVFGVFNDSLPDGWGTLLTDRKLREQGYDPATISVLDKLALVGENGPGALTYHPKWEFPEVNVKKDIHHIAMQVRQILNLENIKSVADLYQMAGSSGGARPKIFTKINGKEWIVKFPSSNDPQNIGEIEYEYSLTAKKCGIEMMETRLFEGKYFGTKRFDREGNKRFHTHSLSGLLYASHRIPSLDYADLIKATLSLTKDISEGLKMFRQMIFNVLTHNRDDHAKNFSFMYTCNKWMVTPAYDLVLSSGFNGQHTTTINGKGMPGKSDLFKVAELSGLPKRQAQIIFDEVFENSKELMKDMELKLF